MKTTIERWEDGADVEIELTTDHFQAFSQILPEYLAFARQYDPDFPKDGDTDDYRIEFSSYGITYRWEWSHSCGRGCCPTEHYSEDYYVSADDLFGDREALKAKWGVKAEEKKRKEEEAARKKAEEAEAARIKAEQAKVEKEKAQLRALREKYGDQV